MVGRIGGRLFTVVYTLRGAAIRRSQRVEPTARKSANMAIVRYVLDPSNPPKMSPETRARLDALTDEQITAAAESNPDNSPLTDAELARFRAVRIAKAARRRTGLSQAKFAQAYHIKVARLRDLEQGRRAPDEVLVSLLTLIGDDPERAARVLREEL